MKAKSNDWVTLKFVEGIVRKIIETRIIEEFEKRSYGALGKSISNAVYVIADFQSSNESANPSTDEFIRVVYVDSKGKNGDDTIYFESIFDALKKTATYTVHHSFIRFAMCLRR